jgi:hypothetical protein
MKAYYTKIDDPGHGWLKVPLSEVQDSGANISKYSYKDETHAYLEEDSDMYKFLVSAKCLINGKLSVDIKHEYQEDCFIRELPRF